MRRLAVAAVALGLVTGLGCRKPPAPLEKSAPSKPVIRSLNALDPATMGTVSGVVTFAGTAPAAMRVDMSADPGCGDGAMSVEPVAVQDGKLANVYVYVKSGPPAAMALGESWMEPVVLDTKGCNFVPHVAAVVVGQRVEFRNDDAVTHTVRVAPQVAGNAPVDITEGPKSLGQMRIFRKPEAMMPVRCGQHAWMSGILNVSPTPFFAVTGADGKFELKGLPAGEYTLGFVQEKMGERTAGVTVKPQATATTDITYSL
jgi:plastocyanin